MPPIIFEKYPELSRNIEWYSIIDSPTPLQELKNLSRHLKIKNLWIKRDDISAKPYGGNKPRKLEFVLPDALKKGCKSIITTGGIGSNHCLATTIYSSKVNIKPILMLFPQQITEHVIKTLNYFNKSGAELHLYDSMESAFLNAIYHYQIKKSTKEKPYLLNPGGSSALGCLGYVNAAFELKQQIDEGVMPEPDYIFVTMGTCGTIAGLLIGTQLCGIKSTIVGVRVVDFIFADKLSLYFLTKKILNFMKNKGANINLHTDFSQANSNAIKMAMKRVSILHSYFGKGYGYPTNKGEKALKLMSEYEGIKLDTTYTAKTFAGFVDFVKKESVKDKVILFWHTFNNQELDV